ncbi:MAG: Dyp-type peroxidase [Proteobacteria bacterium]|nr:Dyp-type peroxidase [Pseudomonadota bacterium]
MSPTQPGILATENNLSRYLVFTIASTEAVPDTLSALAASLDFNKTVVGFGQSLMMVVARDIPGMRLFPALSGSGIEVPSTPAALWCWLRGDDQGELYHRSRDIEALLAPAFILDDVVDSFQYDANRDLSGYEDGTENPQGEEAVSAAIVQGQGVGLDGSSFVAVQQWLHDFEVLDDMSVEQKDNAIGRHISNNEEFDEAPESAHVKRSAQESFDPEAFILRRSMPWADGMAAGLYFVAFGKSLDAFEVILNRMLGHEDNVVDGLFEFTRPISGTYFWCPPVKDSDLDLSALGL